jgi:nucleotide-binding universal stress UspA family protein
MMNTTAQSDETARNPGKPKCLVIVDETPECDRAVYFAARWAARIGGGVVMLRVIETQDRNQQWLGVADIMRAEAQDEAHAALDRALGRARGLAGLIPERVIREGNPHAQILDVITHDPDIALLVLAAATGAEGPGPIVAETAKTVGTFPIPVTIVPGGLGDGVLERPS